MWDNQHSTGMHPKIKVVDGVSDGEVGLELHTKNHGERNGAQEEITDDDVFKELINIVMDVFSNKSEKCMLTFELPVESGVLKELSPEELDMGNSSDVSADASKSDILIPLKGSTHSRKLLNRRKRQFNVPMAKTSKYKLKKKFKKRLSPIVQTALHPKPGFTDLGLFRMYPKRSHLASGGGNDRQEPVAGSSRNVADRWKDIAERDALLKDVSNLKEKIAYPPHRKITDTDAFSNLHSEFRYVLEALEELPQSQELTLGKMSFGELSYHLEEILCHIKAIKNSLQDSQSLESVDTMLQLTSTESSEAPKRKNKLGVKLIRIGAKTGQKSSTQVAPRSKKRRKRKECKQKLKSSRDAGLDEILKKYQRVKKEETEIVQVLLGKLGFHKDQSNQKCRKICSKTPKQELFENTDKKAAQPCNVTAEKIQRREAAQNARDIQEDLNEDKVQETKKEPKNNMNSNLRSKQLVQMSLPENKRDSKQRKEEEHQFKSRKKRKHREPRKKSRSIPKRWKGWTEIVANSKAHSPIILYERPSPFFIERREEIKENSSKDEIRNAMNFIELHPHPDSANKEDRMMRRIQSAARRMEYMHSLVEKKLNRLSKQQKELNRKITGKTCEGYTPRESRSNEDSQADAYDLPQGPILNLSTEIEELIFQPYRNVKLDELNYLKEPLNCRVNEMQCTKEVSTNGKLGENSLRTLQAQGSVNKQFLCESNQNYICNYMMELRGKEFELNPTGLENQHGSERSGTGQVLSSTILTNEFQENSSSNGHNKDPPTHSLLSVTTKENEGEIVEESLFANPLSSNNNSQKPTARKKKKRVIHTPSCSLS